MDLEEMTNALSVETQAIGNTNAKNLVMVADQIEEASEAEEEETEEEEEALHMAVVVTSTEELEEAEVADSEVIEIETTAEIEMTDTTIEVITEEDMVVAEDLHLQDTVLCKEEADQEVLQETVATTEADMKIEAITVETIETIEIEMIEEIEAIEVIEATEAMDHHPV